MGRPCLHPVITVGCKVCWFHANDARYLKLWGPVDAVPPPQSRISLDKPRVSFDDLAQQRHNCREKAKVTGIPCPYEEVKSTMKWSYGVTTVPKRKADLLPRTLASLAKAGWDKPRLFVDGVKDGYEGFNLDVTYRWPLAQAFGNWLLGMIELWIREPYADRFAMFQDDIVCCMNLRSYLEKAPYPKKGYLNLLTFPNNSIGDAIWQPASGGFYESKPMERNLQRGLGAVALVFDRAALTKLLTSYDHILERPLESGIKAHKRIDGGVVSALNKLGWREYVHNPSLVQHTGTFSTMGNKQHPLAPTFRGEDFDALQLLAEK